MPSDVSPEFRLLRRDDMDREDVRSFRCGDEPHEDKVGAYLRNGDAWREQKVEKRNKTYLYEFVNGERSLVGFATLGKKKIALTEDQESKEETVLICWFAIGVAYQGRIDGVSHAENLLGEVVRIALDRDVYGISAFVDDENHRALRFWERVGFVRFDGVPSFVDDDDSVNVFYVLPLRRARAA